MEYLGILLALLVTLPAVYFGIMRNLPHDLVMTPVGDPEIPFDLYPLMARYEDLGFKRLGAWRLQVPTGPTIVAFCRPGEGTFGMVFSFRKMPGKVFFDFTTALAPHPCTLTSGMHVGGGSMPLADADFMQLFPHATVEQLHAAHQQGVAYLCGEGLGLRPPDPDRFEQHLRDSIRRQRDAFTRARVRNTLTALWRVVTHSSPYRGPVHGQRGTRSRLNALLGRRARDREVFRYEASGRR